MTDIKQISNKVPDAITSAVRTLYEAYPYPRYPLLATPRWQDGYLTHSNFASTLVSDLYGTSGTALLTSGVKKSATVLIGGGGEILPYVIRKWEPARHKVISVDLSASSLRRARWRCLWDPRRTKFARADLDQYLRIQTPHTFSHIDVYGVLHHMPNPSETLQLISSRLIHGGTIRVMVYNGEARTWIHHLQRMFALLGIDRLSADDIRVAKELLALAAAASPSLAARLNQLGVETLNNNARFADTFLHPRETRLSVSAWLDAISKADLHIVGLLDRYAELDDLPNPMWQAPSATDLADRARDGRFENNLELYLTHSVSAKTGALTRAPQSDPLWWFPYLLKAPPRLWFSYNETRNLSMTLRVKLWHAHLNWVLRRSQSNMSDLLAWLPTPALQRLVRIGAILPGQVADLGRRAALATPIVANMQPPERLTASYPQCPMLHAKIDEILTAKGKNVDKYSMRVIKRLYKSQF
jgi:SAM-dependent methyltransferase